MAKLLFEIWANSDGQQCARVSELSDRTRDAGAHFVDAFYASTDDEAGRYWHQRNGWKQFMPIPSVTDYPFTEDELAEQEAYLAVRAAQH